MMKPIRKDEQEYLINYLSRKFSSRRSLLETERKIDIDKTVEQNYTKFVKGLNVEKDIKSLQELNNDYNSFVNNMDKIADEKKEKVRLALNKLSKKLESWSNSRRWKTPCVSWSGGSNDKMHIDDIEQFLQTVCEEEAIKIYDKSKKGEAIRLLDAQKEEAENALYSGGSLPAVRNYINGIFTKAGIQDNVAKELLMLSSK
ncbi:MAG: hypothetical protein O3A39_06790 [Proteobacteria bacterium]|nr:hypothetical protein [Pseudomonadota bacterium]